MSKLRKDARGRKRHNRGAVSSDECDAPSIGARDRARSVGRNAADPRVTSAGPGLETVARAQHDEAASNGRVCDRDRAESAYDFALGVDLDRWPFTPVNDDRPSRRERHPADRPDVALDENTRGGKLPNPGKTARADGADEIPVQRGLEHRFAERQFGANIRRQERVPKRLLRRRPWGTSSGFRSKQQPKLWISSEHGRRRGVQPPRLSVPCLGASSLPLRQGEHGDSGECQGGGDDGRSDLDRAPAPPAFRFELAFGGVPTCPREGRTGEDVVKDLPAPSFLGAKDAMVAERRKDGRSVSSLTPANCARSETWCEIFVPDGVTRWSKSRAAISCSSGDRAATARSRWSATIWPAPPSLSSVSIRRILEPASPLHRPQALHHELQVRRFDAAGYAVTARPFPARRTELDPPGCRRRREPVPLARPRRRPRHPRARSSAREVERSLPFQQPGRAGRAARRCRKGSGMSPFRRSSRASVSSRSERSTLTRSGRSTIAASDASKAPAVLVVREVLLRLIEDRGRRPAPLARARRWRASSSPLSMPAVTNQSLGERPASAPRSSSSRQRRAAAREGHATSARRSRAEARTCRPRSARTGQSGVTR